MIARTCQKAARARGRNHMIEQACALNNLRKYTFAKSATYYLLYRSRGPRKHNNKTTVAIYYENKYSRISRGTDTAAYVYAQAPVQ